VSSSVSNHHRTVCTVTVPSLFPWPQCVNEQRWSIEDIRSMSVISSSAISDSEMRWPTYTNLSPINASEMQPYMAYGNMCIASLPRNEYLAYLADVLLPQEGRSVYPEAPCVSGWGCFWGLEKHTFFPSAERDSTGSPPSACHIGLMKISLF
jgi:hypothetical protein